MARVQGNELILDSQGRLLAKVDGAAVTITQADGVTPAIVYAAATGGTTVTQPLTTENGMVVAPGGGEWWLDPGVYKRLATHADGRVLDPVQIDYPSGVDSATLTSVEHRVAYLSVTEAPYNATGNGSTDDTTAITNADAAASLLGKTLLFPAGTYRVSQVLPTTSWRLDGATIKPTTGSTAVLVKIADSVSGVTIEGLRVDGSTASGASTSAMVEIGGDRNKIKNFWVHDAPHDGVLVRTNATGFEIAGGDVKTTGRYGITLTGSLASPAREGSVHDCRVEASNDGGFGIIGVARDVGFTNNIAIRTGGDGFAGYNTDNIRITIDGFISVDANNNGIHLGGSGNRINNISIFSPTQKGIYVQSDLSPAKVGCTVANYTIDGTGGEGILVDNYSRVSIGDGSIANAGTHGMSFISCSKVSITGEIDAAGAAGIRLEKTSKATIKGATITNCAAGSGITGTDDGVTFTTDITVSGCTITDNLRGIQQNVVTASNVWTVVGNTCLRNASGNITQVSLASRCADNNVDDSDTIASATAITVPNGLEAVFLTGSTAITSINSASRSKGRLLTLVAPVGATWTLTDTGGLLLNANFVAGDRDTITLRCMSDGSWYELSRSNN